MGSWNYYELHIKQIQLDNKTDAVIFDYIDDEMLEYEQGMPLYPQIEVGSANRREITNDSN